MTTVEAEAGIEMESAGRGRGNRRYPWLTMEVGESFLITTKSPNTHHSMAGMANIQYAPRKFQGGKDKDGNRRIWRIL